MNPKDFDIGVFQMLNSTSYAFFWLFAIIGLISITLAKVNNTTYISSLFQLSKNYNQKLFSIQSISAPLLIFNYLISLTLFIFIFCESISITNTQSQFKLLTTIFIGVLAFHILKTSFQYLIANWFLRKDMFEIKFAFRQYQIVGLILLPLIIFSTYQSANFKLYTSILSLIIIAVGYILYWYYSFKDSRQYKISLLYNFLYLCTLEILPVILILKLLL